MYFVMYFELHACYYVHFVGIASPVILSILIIIFMITCTFPF